MTNQGKAKDASLLELITRLQNVGWDTWEQCVTGIGEDECHQAADLLSLQADRIAALEGALREIVAACSNTGIGNPIVDERVIDRCDDIARQALSLSLEDR